MDLFHNSEAATMSRDWTQQTESNLSAASGSGQASSFDMEHALSKLSVKQHGAADTSNGDARADSAELVEGGGGGGQSTSAVTDTTTTTMSSSAVDMALVEAMRVPRDKVFVIQHERDMEVKVKDDTIHEWGLPLMNSYHRLLVHRIADHFCLTHTIDQTTKQVTLTKNDNTRIPLTSVATLAENERLSEPAAFPPLLNSLSGQSTPSSSNTPGSVAGGIRIMRRPDGTSRSDSPRNGTATPDDGAGTRRDRRNMTIEEREAAYIEARQRIFGSEGNGDGSPATTVSTDRDSQSHNAGEGLNAAAGSSTRKEGRKANSSGTRSVTPSISSASDSGAGSSVRNAGCAAEDDRFSPTSEAALSPTGPYAPYDAAASGMMRQNMPNPYSYPSSMDQQQAAAYYNQTGVYASGPMQLDAQGRPVMFMMVGGQQWPYTPYPYPNGQPLHYAYSASSMVGENVQSPDASSRSTSLSAGTEGAESTRSSISEQTSQIPYQASNISNSKAPSHQGTPINRSQSVSPTVPYPQQSQQRLATPPSSQVAAGGGTPPYLQQSHGTPWPMMYVHPSMMQAYPPASPYTPPPPMDFSVAMRTGLMRPTNGNGYMAAAASTPPLQTHSSPPVSTSGFGSSYSRQPFNASNGVAGVNGGSGGVSYAGTHSQQGSSSGTEPGILHAMSGSGTSRGRGRSSQGNERSLYDPNKPSAPVSSTSGIFAPSTSASHANGRHSLGKSSSAAAVMENGLTTSSYNRLDGLSHTPTASTTLSGARPSFVSQAQTTRNGMSSSPNTRSASGGNVQSVSSFTSPIHPSLPARPDWAVAARQAGMGQSNSNSSSNMDRKNSAGECNAQSQHLNSTGEAKVAPSLKIDPGARPVPSRPDCDDPTRLENTPTKAIKDSDS